MLDIIFTETVQFMFILFFLQTICCSFYAYLDRRFFNIFFFCEEVDIVACYSFFLYLAIEKHKKFCIIRMDWKRYFEPCILFLMFKIGWKTYFAQNKLIQLTPANRFISQAPWHYKNRNFKREFYLIGSS